MSDKEILSKVYEHLLQREKFWDSCRDKCFDESDMSSLKYLQSVFQGSSITEVRMLIDGLRES